MSSTGRSLVRKGLDQYDTPAWSTELVLPVVVTPRVRKVFDPCAGVGAILDVVRRSKRDGDSIVTAGYEIDRGRAAVCASRGHWCGHVDAMDPNQAWNLEPGVVIITNPPYGLAEEFVRRCLTESDVSRKTGTSAFAPSWDLLRAAHPKFGGTLEWPDYVEAYIDEMRASYRRNRAEWDALLGGSRVVLVCYCVNPATCHRTLLARILTKLGAKNYGEITEWDQTVEEPLFAKGKAL